jgi:predicted peroxiredoxin
MTSEIKEKAMKRVMCLVLVLVSCSIFLMMSGITDLSAGAQDKQQIVVHLRHYTDDLHAVLMALRVAGITQGKGAQVTLMLDLEGVRLADARQPNDLQWGHGGTVAEAYDAFVKAGGKILVCRHCAMAAGIDEKSLRPGAQMAQEGGLADLIMAADKVLDY